MRFDNLDQKPLLESGKKCIALCGSMFGSGRRASFVEGRKGGIPAGLLHMDRPL